MDFERLTPRTVTSVLCAALALACAGSAIADDPDPGGAAFPDNAAPAGRAAMLGDVVVFRGKALSGTKMAVQRLEDGAWVTIARATAGRSGRYAVGWRTDVAGQFQIRTVTAGAAAVQASAGGENEHMTVYRRAQATWYGKGWYGRKTACGQTLSPTLMGVAHKTLPCGTMVAFYYKGRTVTVPVIDRGPYGRGLSWDLTTAAAEQLDFIEVGRDTLGAVRVGR